MSDIDIHNDSFTAINEEINTRLTALEGMGGGENHLIYPQKWATGIGTVDDPWVNDCIQKAYNACPAGGTIYLRAGYYIAETATEILTITKSINVIGEGIGKTFLVTSTAHGIYIGDTATDYVTLKGFTIDGTAQEDNTNSGLYIVESNYSQFIDLEIKECGKYGQAVGEKNNYSLYQNIHAHDNYRHGMHPGTNLLGWNSYNTYRDLYLYDNGSAGISDVGNQVYTDEWQYNVYDNIHAWGNTSPGIEIDNQRGATITNCFAYGNGTSGFSFDGLKDSHINNCITRENNYYGLYLLNSKNINITNILAKSNKSGIRINDCSCMALTACQLYDDTDIPLQEYGLMVFGESMGISLLNCKLTPNKNGAIYNPNSLSIGECPCNIL